MDSTETIEAITNLIIDVPDFPKPGILFKDLSLVFSHKLVEASQELLALFHQEEFDYIAGIDARGFIIASAMSVIHGCKFLPVRKSGKLPGRKVSYVGTTEYSEVTLEVKPFEDILRVEHLPPDAAVHSKFANNNVLLVDDVLATGGSFEAAGTALILAGYMVVGFGAIVDLRMLNQFNFLDMKCKSLVQY